jgi:hypothetical protein
VDYELTVNIPTAGDTSVLIVGIGEVKNNSTVLVTAEQAANFKNLTGTTLGRAKFMDGIEAKTVRGEKSNAKPVGEPEEPAHVAGTPAPVQNKDGETAKGDK